MVATENQNTNTPAIQNVYETIGSSRWLAWALLAIGIGLRLIQYFHDRSLWIDEARLAFNILGRSFSELSLPLEHDQGSPLGFLYLVKLVTEALGQSEYVLRLVPLLSSIVGLLLFYWIARRVLSATAATVAVAFAAFCGPLIYYAAELKQYSTDMLVALIVLALGLEIYANRLSIVRLLVFGVVGGILIWFSHPTVFVLGGVGGGLLLAALLARDWSRLVRLGAIVGMWLVSFGIFYFSTLKTLTSNEYLLEFWQSGFIPLSPLSLMYWFSDNFVYTFNIPVGFALTGLALFVFVVGILTLYTRNRNLLFMVIGPVLVTMLAAVLGQYPFADRMILFLVPFYILLIAEGSEQVRGWLFKLAQVKDQYQPIMTVVGLIFVGLLFLYPVRAVATHITVPYEYPSFGLEDIKSVLNYLTDAVEPGDTIYIYHQALLTYRYYESQYDLGEIQLIEGEDSDGSIKRFDSELQSLTGTPRIWFVFTHVLADGGFNEEVYFTQRLDELGTRLDTFQADGASAYLYDLSE